MFNIIITIIKKVSLRIIYETIYQISSHSCLQIFKKILTGCKTANSISLSSTLMVDLLKYFTDYHTASYQIKKTKIRESIDWQ